VSRNTRKEMDLKFQKLYSFISKVSQRKCICLFPRARISLLAFFGLCIGNYWRYNKEPRLISRVLCLCKYALSVLVFLMMELVRKRELPLMDRKNLNRHLAATNRIWQADNSSRRILLLNSLNRDSSSRQSPTAILSHKATNYPFQIAFKSTQNPFKKVINIFYSATPSH